MNKPLENFESKHARLEEITEAVCDESLELDAALDLYEEAISVCMEIGSVLEEGIPDNEKEEVLKEVSDQEGVLSVEKGERAESEVDVDSVGDGRSHE